MAVPTHRTAKAGHRHLLADLDLAGAIVATTPRDEIRADLLAYSTHHHRLNVLPLKVTSTVGPGFAIDVRWALMPRLRVVHVWLSSDLQSAEVYAPTYVEALEILKAHRWASSPSWLEHGRYTSGDTTRIRELMTPHRIGVAAWSRLLHDDQ